MNIKLGVTIDGPQSRDLDDAIWLDESDGCKRVRVCIADVAASIPMDSPVDVEARRRGYTRYFATGNVPMLPRPLAEDRLSLLPGKRRRVFCIEIELDANLEVCRTQVSRTDLQSMAQLSYPQAAEIVRGQAQEVDPMLVSVLEPLAQIATALLEKRWQRGELAVYDISAGWMVTEEGQIRRLNFDEANIGYVIVQELMLLTNRTIAEHLLRANVPALFRNHKAHVAAPDHTALLHEIETTLARPDLFDLNTLRQRMSLILTRARYEPQAKGHYGLNLPVYMHFTSPIRRYADLVNQRVLAAVMGKLPPVYSVAELAVIGDHLNALRDAEREKQEERERSRKEAKAEADLKAEADQIAALAPKDAYRMLQKAEQLPAPPVQVAHAIHKRMGEGTLTLKEVFALIFESPMDNPQWQPLRRIGLDWLRRQPEHAVSMLSMGVGLLGWPQTEYRFGMDNGEHSCRATLQTGQGALDSNVHYNANKKIAQQQAALALCHLLCGYSIDPTPRRPAQPPKPGRKQAQDADSYNWSGAQKALDRGDYVSAICQACAQTQRKRPRFHFEQIGSGTEQRHRCSAILKWGEQELQGEGEGASQKEAKNRAAEALVAVLQDK